MVSETKSEVATPKYSICDEDPHELVVRVWLPGVSSVSDVDLDLSEGGDPVHVCVQVEGQFELELDLPGDLDTNELSAKFDKAQSLLTLSLPQL